MVLTAFLLEKIVGAGINASSTTILSLLLAQAVIILILLGTLIVSLFDKKKEYSDGRWFLVLTLLWLIFLLFGGAALFYESFNTSGLIAIISFSLMGILFLRLIIKRFIYFNKPLLFTELVLLILIFTIVFGGNMSSLQTGVLLSVMTFVSSLLGYFIVINFLIRTSIVRGRLNKRK